MNIKRLLQKIQKIWKSRNEILQGLFFKFIKYDSYVEELAAARFMICMQCPKLDGVGTYCEVPGTNPCCAECGCSLSIKLRSMSSECPLGKWKAVMSQEQEDKLNR